MLRPKTPIEFLAPGVDPSLNREPPSAVDVRRMIFLLGLFLLLICGLVTFVVMQISANRPPKADGAAPLDLTQEVMPSDTPTAFLPSPTNLPTETTTPAPTSTLDDWSLTGTALFFSTSTATPTPSPTLDYCWWLTPTPTPTYTPNLPTPTLDDWSATGTAMFIEAHTPTPTFEPTSRPPRLLCDNIPPATLDSSQITEEVFAYPRDGKFPTLDNPITPPATWTPVPVDPILQGGGGGSQPRDPLLYPQPTAEIIYITVPAPINLQPTNPPIFIVITATRQPQTATPLPTSTFTPSLTASPTDTATSTPTNTDTPTLTPSLTPTDTATSTATPSPTNTDVPTSTPIPTETLIPPSPTNTDIPTATMIPTSYPALQILSGDCSGGHLTFLIGNAGGDLLEQLQWRLVDQFLLINSTGFFGGLGSGQTTTIDLGTPVPGLWILGFDYLGQSIYSNQVLCEEVASP